MDEVFAEIQQALEQVGDRDDHPQVRRARSSAWRAPGEVVADTLALIGEHVRPGVTTAELDELAEEFIRSRGGDPTFKGYRGYPAAICTSPNEMVVHGIPGPYALADGDILSVDVGVTLDGFVADSAYTFAVGEISAEAERLLDALPGRARGRDRAVPRRQPALRHLARDPGGDRGRRASRSSAASSATASAARCTRTRRSRTTASRAAGPLLAEGMTFAIEPMITAGGPDVVLHDDEWSISTADGSLSAHFEHTVAITADGPRILTAATSAVRS